MKSNIIFIDVMTDYGRTFYHTLRYPYCPLFKFDIEKLVAWLTDKLPSLLYRKDAVLFLKFPDGNEIQLKITNKTK